MPNFLQPQNDNSKADWLAVEIHLVNMIDLGLQLMNVFDQVLMKALFYCNLSFDF